MSEKNHIWHLINIFKKIKSMKYRIVLLTLFIFQSFCVFSQEDKPIKITHGPYLCDMTQDAVTIVWATNKPALSWVELAPDNDESFYATKHPQFYEIEAGRKQARKILHKVRLTNLGVGTNYRYRVFSKEVLSWGSDNQIKYGATAATNVYQKKPLHFRTFRDKAEDISFIVLNDIHGKSDFMKDLCKDIDFKSLDFVMQNGDMANSIESEEQIFTDFIDASVDLFASETPFMYCRGNHETRGKYADSLLEYLPTSDQRFYHLYTIGDVAFLVLDGGEDKPDTDIEYSGISAFDQYREEQAKWLTKAIETPEFKNAKSRIVFLHIPPMVGSWHGAKHLMELFIPILNNANIDVMFSGHTHNYSFQPVSNQVHFPTVVNGNKTYLQCKISPNNIKVQVVGLGGKVEKEHLFDLK